MTDAVSNIIGAVASHLRDSGIKMEAQDIWDSCHLLECGEQLQIYYHEETVTLAHRTRSASGWLLVGRFDCHLADPCCLENAAKFAESVKRPARYCGYNPDLEMTL